MTLWQKRARLAVATFGLASAVVVYFAIGERKAAPPRPAVPTLEPRAVLEGLGGWLEQVAGSRQTFIIRAARTVTYDDGSTRLLQVQIHATNRNGRTFVVTAREGRATKDNTELELMQDVVLRESDGFELRTGHGVFHKETGTVRADGEVSFSKGRMAGTGRGMTYAQDADLLRIGERARVDVAAAGAGPAMSFAASSVSLDRLQHRLSLEGMVHAVQGDQVTDADAATAHLTDTDDSVTYVELRGRASVSSASGPLASMRGRDIDLDYSDGGTRVERAVLTGDASITVRGEGGPGREFAGGVLDIALRDDGSIARMIGMGGVRMIAPQAGDVPARRIDSNEFDASGTEAGITAARFTGDVVYRETPKAGGPARVARSRELTIEMQRDEIGRAVFGGGATFEDADMVASAREAAYVPGEGRLRLTGTDGRGRPTLSDDRVIVEADWIDVGLEGRRVDASTRVKASFRAPAAGARTAPAAAREGRLPGLLRQDEPAIVVSQKLAYVGADGSALFSGGALLWQGATEIRADSIDMQQERGDLTATGDARSTLALGDGRSEGRAHEIRYMDGERVISYRSSPPSPGTTAVALARLIGPEGDLQARRIDVVLARGESRVERVEAQGTVTAVVMPRTVTGDALTYRAADESYQVSAAPEGFVTVEESCRVATGRTLTFSRSTDTMSIDGRTEFRTQLKSRSTCTAPASR